MALTKSVFLVLAFVVLASAQLDKIALEFDSLDAGTGKLLEVRLSNCATLPCVFKKGTSTTIEMDFIPDVGTNSVMTGAVAQVGPIRLPFRGINQTPACDKITEVETGLTVGCNLQAGKTYTYSFDLPILGRYPTANAQVQWELQDAARSQKIVCFQIPVKITA